MRREAVLLRIPKKVGTREACGLSRNTGAFFVQLFFLTKERVLSIIAKMENPESPGKSSPSQKIGPTPLLIIGFIVVLFLIAGGGLFFLNKKNLPQIASETMTHPTATPIPTKAVTFNSIQDALSKSLSLQCNYTDDSGRQITASIKNGAVRADIKAPKAQESGSMVMKDKVIYFWNGDTGTEMTYDPEAMMAHVTVTPSTPKSTSSAKSNGQDVISAMENFKQYCKPAAVSDDIFTPPSTVKFTNLTEMMKQIPSVMPTGMMEHLTVTPTAK